MTYNRKGDVEDLARELFFKCDRAFLWPTISNGRWMRLNNHRSIQFINGSHINNVRAINWFEHIYLVYVETLVTYKTMQIYRDHFQRIDTSGLCWYENSMSLWREFICPLHDLDISERPLTTHLQYDSISGPVSLCFLAKHFFLTHDEDVSLKYRIIRYLFMAWRYLTSFISLDLTWMDGALKRGRRPL